MSGHEWKPGDIGAEIGSCYIANGDGVLSYLDADGDPIPRPEQVHPTGLRAIPIPVCERRAEDVRSAADLLSSTLADPNVELTTGQRDEMRKRRLELLEDADILDPPAPQPEPEWVTLDAGNGDTWQPSVSQVQFWRGAVDDSTVSLSVQVLYAAVLALVDAQLADGKELRP